MIFYLLILAYYRAPFLWKKGKIDYHIRSIDIWAIGCIIFEILFKKKIVAGTSGMTY